MKTVILGLGNTILSDDAVGIIVARKVYKDFLSPSKNEEFGFIEASYSGWRIIDYLQGYDRAVIIDSIKGGGGRPGDCYEIEREKINSIHLQSSHGMGFNEALALAEKIGMKMPAKISIFAIEVNNPYEFGETISPEIEEKIDEISVKIAEEIKRGGNLLWRQ